MPAEVQARRLREESPMETRLMPDVTAAWSRTRQGFRRRWAALAVGLLAALLAPAAAAAPTVNLTVLHQFGFADGFPPSGGLVLGADGNLYGSSEARGMAGDPNPSIYVGYGTVWRLTPAGNFTVIYNFNYDLPAPADALVGGLITPRVFGVLGAGPGPLVAGKLGFIYGTTGGTYVSTGILGLDIGGLLSTLLGFNVGPDLNALGYPAGNIFVFSELLPGVLLSRYAYGDAQRLHGGLLVVSGDGSLYGNGSGAGPGGSQVEAIYKLSPSNQYSTLCSFSGSASVTSLMQAADGSLYGTLAGGSDYGSVFRLSTQGVLTPLHSFGGADGSYPGTLLQLADGNFYGTTEDGGAYGYGTVFRMTATGAVTVLHSFDKLDGSYPAGGLLLAHDGYLYGNTSGGGAYTAGTLFRITTNGAFTKLLDFNGEQGGPTTTLVQAAGGTIYGNSEFAVFALSVKD